ncbi:MAG: glucosamine-6-phosphate deaminase [Planctomycetota bacterium]
MTYLRQSPNGPEKIPTEVFATAHEATLAVATIIADLIRRKAAQKTTCVLGLATGSTPMSVYNELVRMHRQEGLSFANVVCFNLDEYYPMQPRELQSYVRFMHEHLFANIDIDPANVHIPDGTVALGDVQAFCDSYEQAIFAAGGIDLQLLGVGRTGHIGFNEPGSAETSRTRLITLDRLTRRDAAADFFGEDYVPRRGITMGVATILEARQIVLLAFGENKSAVLSQAIEGPITESVPASFLQQHDNIRILLDGAAAAGLTRCRSPWLAGPVVHWDAPTVRKAVIWLAQKLNKPILKLTVADYNENSLQDMLAEQGSAYDVNIRVFRSLQQTITGWPGGKPGSARQTGDVPKPHDRVFPKRVLVFSPHPDDDVISMGGTLIRLASQGHEVHVAYQTSGGIAVFDHCALRFADFAVAFNRLFGIDHGRTADLEAHIEQFLRHKLPGQVDSPEVQELKAMIRRGEARSAGRLCGLKLENLHFLDMPFYDTGTVVKRQLSDADIKLIVDLTERIQPHQIYAAGDLSDPHGTHRVCLKAIELALGGVKDNAWLAECELWLYRGAWQEWEPDCIDMAVPLSPEELLGKRNAIFRHESQKDRALFPGSDDREFWQRAEDRNRRTAVLYDKLGLSEYEAIEAFRRWTPKLT